MGERKTFRYIHSDWIANTSTIQSMQFRIAISKRGLPNRVELLDYVEWWIQWFKKKLRDGLNYTRNLCLKEEEIRGYGEIGRRYGLDCIEPWYGNLLSGNFQIQRNPGIKKGQSWAKSVFWENLGVLELEYKGKG